MMNSVPSESRKAASRGGSRRLILLIGAGAVVLAAWFCREPLRGWIAQTAILANDAPRPEVVEDIIRNARDPRAALLAAWNSGKIVHREVAIRLLAQLIPSDEVLAPELEGLLVRAALDPDFNVRESAFGYLEQRQHSALPALAAAQLRDLDPSIRLLGLNHLKSVSAATGIPTVIPLLADADPAVVAMTLKLLENWSGEKFGLKLGDAVAVENAITGLKEYPPETYEKASTGVARARTWWTLHQAEFPPIELLLPAQVQTARQPVPAGDFQLRSLDGELTRLSGFRGKVVVLNFWTTWCTACVGEMPLLNAAQRKYPEEAVILGVSLDFVPDEHGHLEGLAAVEEQGSTEVAPHSAAAKPADVKRIREKVARTASARKIIYPILLDEHNEVGGRFNGGELPTTVIIDPHGNIYRRFIGARSLAVFEAMIAAARRE